VDREGTRKGFDCELVREVSMGVPIPVIASGGMGGFSDFAEVVESGHADAVAMATVFHYGEISVMDLRRDAITRGIKVRNVEV